MDEKLYYIQDTRTVCGNSVMWWRHDSCGYTSDLSEAKKVTQDWSGRDTDVLRRVSTMKSIATLQVDIQKLNRI